MIEPSEDTEKRLESMVLDRLTHSSITTAQTVSTMALVINDVLLAYGSKLTESISNCETMEEVHELLGTNRVVGNRV